MNHEAGSLPELVQNLVKNWEVEASFKPNLADWRTIDHENYSFAINGGKPEGAEAMLKVGTYNAIITPNEYYSPEHSDFASSHKTFKRMMPTFAWEVLEVYSGPVSKSDSTKLPTEPYTNIQPLTKPTVAFRWRHWGVMKNDYVGLNNKGEKVTVKAHGGPIDVQGVTVATVNDKVQLQSVRTWFDPMDMFRQIDPESTIKKESVPKGVSPEDALEDAQAGVEVPKEQTLPDRTVQSAQEARETEKKMDREMPLEHPPVNGDGAAGGCPFMSS